MGCASSTVAVADLNKSLKAGESGRSVLLKLEAAPWLLSTPTSVITTTAGTPLHVACEHKQLQVVQQMLSFLSCSPLCTVREALQPYCRRMGQQLPGSPAEGVRMAVDMINCKGQTPLMYACTVGSPELVKLLLSQGADPWVGDRCGSRTALHYAAMSGSAACVEAILAHVAPRHMSRQGVRLVNARSFCGLTALHYAVFFDHTQAVAELLRHDPLLSAVTSSKSYDMLCTCETLSSPLHFAAIKGNAETARQLLQHHALLSAAARGQDPRLQRNAAHQLPWQVAASHHPGSRDLVAMLHPGQALERALGLVPGGGPGSADALRTGPASLATLAAAALQAKLRADLERALPHQEEEGDTEKVEEEQGQRQDGGEDDGLCGVCFAEREQVAPAGCRHGLCGRCAAELCRGMQTARGGRPRPLGCPFCRREVSAFVAVASEPGPSGGQAACGGRCLPESAGGVGAAGVVLVEA
ncbi:hypothetical protein HYH03_017433 [Edaphochlamys debaryana]|uniref:RING-type domain-containing protein n=1 Tax=Edaphochlamys debaryana TaxID=47281 RepID=A0A836BP52_9CHLO|nr:hypothetical protein HYH03_017433 [Edaphochlamys debaryana]|eukprot:KAG2483715.1 hypothetical protein HYH03_017433 [Edaphochlamys debaryana]